MPIVTQWHMLGPSHTHTAGSPRFTLQGGTLGCGPRRVQADPGAGMLLQPPWPPGSQQRLHMQIRFSLNGVEGLREVIACSHMQLRQRPVCCWLVASMPAAPSRD